MSRTSGSNSSETYVAHTHHDVVETRGYRGYVYALLEHLSFRICRAVVETHALICFSYICLLVWRAPLTTLSAVVETIFGFFNSKSAGAGLRSIRFIYVLGFAIFAMTDVIARWAASGERSDPHLLLVKTLCLLARR